MDTTIKLLAVDGYLYTPNSAIDDKLQREWAEGKDCMLVGESPGGDPCTARWPNPNMRDLQSCLYDAREMGTIPDVKSVLLPDGTEFIIDANHDPKPE
jgi:hypothetical protein